MTDIPKISVVTVVFNSVDAISRTIESVKNQTYNNIEYIVIDGGSTDGTLDHINRHEGIISVLVSEADEGIYDAMNKGAAISTGEYIAFMNAGDIYYSDSVIENIFTSNDIDKYDVIYGSNYHNTDKGMLLQKPRPLSLFYKGMPFNHQSIFVRADIVKLYPFNHKVYIIQCEYEFLLNLYLKDFSFMESNEVVAVYEAGGFSDVNFLERTLERWLIIKRANICDDVADKHYHKLIAGSLGVSIVESTSDKRLSLFKRLLS